jgi:hypothetical protein
MARPNVTVIIDDQSFVIPGTESGGAFRAGFVSENGLLTNLGVTSERSTGSMVVSNLQDWFGKLSSHAPIGSGLSADGVYHYSNVSNGNITGGTGMERWPQGPTGSWEGEWWTVHNYLQYGGIAVIGATGVDENTGSTDSLSNRQLELDGVVCMSSTKVGLTSDGVSIGSQYYTVAGDITNANSVVNAREDCIGVYPYAGGTTANNSVDASPSVSGSITNNEYAVAVFGAKRFLGINKNPDSDVLEMNCAPDVAGCMARTDRISDPWVSPAGFKRGGILNVLRLAYNPTNAEQDTLYAEGINPVVVYPGEGVVLFGDKTLAGDTSTLSRINVSRLFIYLKKVVGSAARSLLFEMNDESTRSAFVNTVSPLLNRIKARRGIYDYKVVCDESNNTADIIDSNQFVADVFIKPSKSINFIRITFTNVNTSVNLNS